MQRPRILMVTASLGYGGAEGSFVRLAQYLSQFADVKIALMAQNYGGGGYCSAEAEIAMPVVLLECEHCASSSPVAKLRRWSRMRRRLSELKIEHDVTISFLSGPNLLNSLAGLPERTLISERGSKRFDTSTGLLRRTLWRKILDPIAYRGSVSIVAASEGLAREITGTHPLLAGRVVAIEGSVHTRAIVEASKADVPSDFEAFQHYKTVISFGRIHQQKGYDALLQVFGNVRRREPQARLLLIGDGPELGAYMHLAKGFDLRAGREPDPRCYDVVFAGYQSAPLRFLKLAHLFAFPSRYEGLPNALIEGLASGVPILAADCPWGPRSILSGPNDISLPEKISAPVKLAHGTLMPTPDSAEGLAAWEDELFKELHNPPRRRPVEERRAAIARFDIEVTGPQWLRLIDDIMARQAERAANGGNMYGGRSIVPSSGRR